MKEKVLTNLSSIVIMYIEEDIVTYKYKYKCSLSMTAYLTKIYNDEQGPYFQDMELGNKNYLREFKGGKQK